MVRVSVIIPAFNAQSCIPAALASLQGQTEQQLEILVVDDYSTDATAEIVRRFAAEDDRIELLSTAENGGPGAARNVGLSAAQGEWIALLDADDLFDRERIEKLLRLAETHDAEMIADNLLLCPGNASADGVPMLSRSDLPSLKQLSTADFIAGNVGSRYQPRVSLGFVKPILRRAFLDQYGLRYDTRNRFGEDYMFYVTCLMRGARFWMTPEPMYHYCVAEGSLTEAQTAADLARIRAMESELLEQPDVRRDRSLQRAIARHKSVIDRCYYYRAFTDAVKGGAHGEATRLLFESPTGFRHIATESLVQAPTVLAKALRGGYSRRYVRARPSD
jgi:glycosyltransferase involved in cell wall biosynthesis